jgi:hypothetical protein
MSRVEVTQVSRMLISSYPPNELYGTIFQNTVDSYVDRGWLSAKNPSVDQQMKVRPVNAPTVAPEQLSQFALFDGHGLRARQYHQLFALPLPQVVNDADVKVPIGCHLLY